MSKESKLETQQLEADLNHAFHKITEGSPELANLFSPKNPMMQFPGGLKYHYYRLDVGKRYYMYAYSTVRNANGKFTSWVYKPKWVLRRIDGDDRERYRKILSWTPSELRETRKYKSAKMRAWKKYESHRDRIEKGVVSHGEHTEPSTSSPQENPINQASS